jgi:hypothetical protein
MKKLSHYKADFSRENSLKSKRNGSPAGSQAVTAVPL